MSTWLRKLTKTLDQREEKLPPTWSPREIGAVGSPIQDNGVFRIERARTAARSICDSIDRARYMVVVTTFLLADREIEDALLRAAKRGVRVYLLLATEARLEKEVSDDSEFERQALDQHKAMLGALAGWALIRSSKSFHAKAVLIDPLDGGAGYLLTANLTERALDRNEELAVALSPAEVRAVFEHLRWAMWEGADHELLEPGRLSAAAQPLGVVKRPSPSAGIVATMNEPGSLQPAALELIDAASTEILVASFGWDVNSAVVRALCEKAKQGVKVTILARIRPAAMPALLALEAAGARVFGLRWLHAKAIVIDSGQAIVMSANLEPEGLEKGFELGIRLEKERASAVRRMLEGWMSFASMELLGAPRLSDIRGEALVWVERKLLAYTVVPEAEVALGAVKAESADRLEAPPPPAPRRQGFPHPAHSLSLSWSVEAPRLAPKSKEIASQAGAPSPTDPRVFREPSGRIVVAVRSADDLPRARDLASKAGALAIVVWEGAG